MTGQARIQEPHFSGRVVELSRLLDADPLTLLHGGDGVCTARGTVDGDEVMAYCVRTGALTRVGSAHVRELIAAAAQEGRPLLAVWQSGGTALDAGLAGLHALGDILAATARASGRVPQIAVVLGTVAGLAAHGAALGDVVVLSGLGRMMLTTPEAARRVTGEIVTVEGLGGPDVHARRSGVAHVVTDGEREAFDRTRRLVGLLAQRTLAHHTPMDEHRDLRALLPGTARRAYDVRPLVRAILDPGEPHGGFEELQDRWARNVVIGLGRLTGRTVGVIANNPLHKGGCLDSLSTEKAARFVRMCDSLGIPLLVVVDVPGYLPGLGQEWDGVVRRGAKLLHAFAESVVPRVTLITRKSYGGAYIAMNSRALGATAVFAWPEAEIAVMGAEAAVSVLHRRRLAAAPAEEREALRVRLIGEQRAAAGGVEHALAMKVVDEVIEPSDTRRKLAEALAAALPRRGRHSNILL